MKGKSSKGGNSKIRDKVLPVENDWTYRVLLPLSNIEEAILLRPLAETIVNDRKGQLILLNVMIVPGEGPLSDSATQVIRFRQSVDESFREESDLLPQSRTLVCSEHEFWNEIWKYIEREKINLLLFGWSTTYFPHATIEDMDDKRIEDPPCDIAAVRIGKNITDNKNWKSVKSVLLPVRGGVNAGQALRIGNALSKAAEAEITLLHVTSERTRLEKTKFLDEFIPALYGLETVTQSLTVKGDISESIIEESHKHDVIILGAPTRNAGPRPWTGPPLDEVRANSDATLIVVKDCKPSIEEVSQTQEPKSVPVERPVGVVVDKWFAENTYHSREFADLERMVALKNSQRLRISLGLPALNEEKTVGKVITTIKTTLMEEFPLLDEIVLIDSGSVDYTREIAADCGIPVFIHQDILPKYGFFHGKGEALWKSLYVLEGDIIAWIDTDIRNIHPRFVYGILGPLLGNPKIQYVKGFYRRPLKQGEKLVNGGGGRVTELTARPFINLFFPELSGMMQPLAGEYAGRRSTLEKLPFFTGYGVETGLLIDILEMFGLRSIAQCDLQQRIHHNQPLGSLSKMSFAIMQVIFKRIENQKKVNLLVDANKTMNLIRYRPGFYTLESEVIQETERPPIITLPEYRQKQIKSLEVDGV